MGSISNLSSYLLSSLFSSGSGSSSLLSSSSSSSLSQELAEALAGSSSSSGSGSANSYLLDLSPAAQQILSSAESSLSTSSSSSGSSTNFTLTSTQQTAIENIVAKYKNAPFTQATFTEIENDLQAAGLSPQDLAAKDEINSFNPTTVLLGDLNGDYTNVSNPTTVAANENTKENNYLQSIVSLWKSESTTASSASGVSTSSASGSSASSGSGTSS